MFCFVEAGDHMGVDVNDDVSIQGFQNIFLRIQIYFDAHAVDATARMRLHEPRVY